MIILFEYFFSFPSTFLFDLKLDLKSLGQNIFLCS